MYEIFGNQLKYNWIKINALSAAVFLASCGSSGSSLENDDQIISADEQLNVPDEETGLIEAEALAVAFFSESTVLIDVELYEKPNDNGSRLVDRKQIDPSNLSESATSALSVVNNLSHVPFGISTSDENTFVPAFRPCQGEEEPQELNYVFVSTDNSGDQVVIVNSDFCGFIPNINFEDIDGQVGFNDLRTFLFFAEETQF